MVTSAIEPPHIGWSNEIPIATFNLPGSISNSAQYRLFDCISFNEGYLISYIDEKGLHVALLDSFFSIVNTKLTPLDYDENIKSLHLQVHQNGAIELSLYSMENNQISFFEVYPVSFECKPMDRTLTDIEVYCFSEDTLYYVINSQLFARDLSNNRLISEVNKIDALAALNSSTQESVFTVESKDNKRLLCVYTVDLKRDKTTRKILKQLPSDNSISFQNLDAVVKDNEVILITVLRNIKTSFNISELLTFSADSLDLLTVDSLAFSEYLPDPYLFVSGNQLMIGYTNSQKLGRTDVSRKYSKYPNYTLSELNKGRLENTVKLTRTEQTKIKPIYLHSSQQNALFWMVYKDDSFVIYGSSDDPTLVKKSQSVSINILYGALMNSITTYFPAYYASMVLIFSVLVPVIVVYGLLSFFMITWMEKHGKIIIWYMVVAHLILKYFTFVPTIKMTLSEMNGLNFLYSSFYGQILFSFALTLISLVSFLLYNRQHPQSSAFVQYLRFAFLDCLLLITAFYPLYFV